MKRALAALVLAAATVVLVVFAPSPTLRAEAGAASSDPVERGRYLVAITGCNDCHTPFKMGTHGPEPDRTRLLSGHPAEAELAPPPAATGAWIWSGSATNTAFAGPWGVSIARNLTPDAETGLGSWSFERFDLALRKGRHLGQPDQRPVLPPMPSPAYANLTDEDLAAIWAYLRSVPAIANAAPPSAPAPPPAP
jgi:cytochrome c553